MKQIRIQINDLIDQHGATFGDCPGCSICSQIEALRNNLLQEPADRFAHILQKGEDMTRSDIAFLLESDVTRKTIKKHLKMGSNEFQVMLMNFGLLRRKSKGDGEMAKAKLVMSVDEFIQLKHIENLSIMKIAELKGVSDPTVHHWMKKHNAEIGNALNTLKKQHEPQNEIKEVPESHKKAEENDGKLQALKSELKEKDLLIKELEKQLDLEKTKKEKYYDRGITLIADRAEEIDNLKMQLKDLQEEMVPLRLLALKKLQRDLDEL